MAGRDSSSVSKLFEAIRQDKNKVVGKLIAEGIPVNAVDSLGRTGLFIAVQEGTCNMVEFLLQSNANPNFRCVDSATPLHAACKRGSRAMLRLLLECGGDLRLRDDKGMTPHDWALEHPDPQCRRKLIPFINNKRALAYRFEDTDSLLDENPNDSSFGIRKKLGLRRKLQCVEKVKPNGGFGIFYCSPFRETGLLTSIPVVSSSELFNCDDSKVIWSGPQTVMQHMIWDKLKVTVKRSIVNSGGVKSDVVIVETENIRKLSYHPYCLCPIAVSPIQNMDDSMLVFECIHYGSLFNVLHDSGSLSMNQSQQLLLIMQQVSEALMFLHSKNLVHCCISPYCIYVITPFLGKLGGFEYMTNKSDGQKKYKPNYGEALDSYYRWMAPEVLDGAEPSKLSDIYEMCTVIWEVATGEIPWSSENRRSLTKRLVTDKMPLPVGSDIPLPLNEVLQCGLKIDAKTRDTDMEEIYQVLSAMVDEADIDFAVSSPKSDIKLDSFLSKSRQSTQKFSKMGRPSRLEENNNYKRFVQKRLPFDIEDMSDRLFNLGRTKAEKFVKDSGKSSIASSLELLDYQLLPTKDAGMTDSKSVTEASTQTETERCVKFGENFGFKPLRHLFDEPDAPGFRRSISEKPLRPYSMHQPSFRRFSKPLKPASHASELSPFAGSRVKNSLMMFEKRNFSDSNPSNIAQTPPRASQIHADTGYTKPCFEHDSDLDEIPEENSNTQDTIPKETFQYGASVIKSPEKTNIETNAEVVRLGEDAEEFPDKSDTSELQAVHTDDHHSYEVKVLTVTAPTVQHTFTVTKTNLDTGRTKVTEKCTDSSVIQVEWNNQKQNLSISVPDQESLFDDEP